MTLDWTTPAVGFKGLKTEEGGGESVELAGLTGELFLGGQAGRGEGQTIPAAAFIQISVLNREESVFAQESIYFYLYKCVN